MFDNIFKIAKNSTDMYENLKTFMYYLNKLTKQISKFWVRTSKKYNIIITAYVYISSFFTVTVKSVFEGGKGGICSPHDYKTYIKNTYFKW